MQCAWIKDILLLLALLCFAANTSYAPKAFGWWGQYQQILQNKVIPTHYRLKWFTAAEASPTKPFPDTLSDAQSHAQIDQSQTPPWLIQQGKELEQAILTGLGLTLGLVAIYWSSFLFLFDEQRLL